MSYQAVVTRVHNVRPHPNADKILLATAEGCQVVVGLSTPEGALGVFFPSDGQLSEEFIIANNLYNKSAMDSLGIPYAPDHKFGFFDRNRRVRAQKFRGEKSDGFYVPLTYFQTLGDYQQLVEGMTFDTFNGTPICNKYVTEKTKQASMMKLGKRQRENIMFPKHDVTKRYGHVGHEIPAGSTIYITEKLHGTSGRYGYVLDDVPQGKLVRTWNTFSAWVWDKFMIRLPYVPAKEYKYLNGSKNVILEKADVRNSWYGTDEFRYKAIEGLTLKKGEIIYFEIVGSFLNKDGKVVPIMEPQPIKDEVKSLKKVYGDVLMNYKYGTEPGTPDIYVYKIVLMNEDGYGVEYSWNQLVGRCKELGLKHVPLLKSLVKGEDAIDDLVEELTEGPSTLDSSHIREGIVLRVENESGVMHVKNKSWWFGVLEGYLKDSEEYVDLEESS